MGCQLINYFGKKLLIVFSNEHEICILSVIDEPGLEISHTINYHFCGPYYSVSCHLILLCIMFETAELEKHR